jgi:hypothetical protein
MGAGTDVAIEASDLTLVRGDLLDAVDAIRIARRTPFSFVLVVSKSLRLRWFRPTARRLNQGDSATK